MGIKHSKTISQGRSFSSAAGPNRFNGQTRTAPRQVDGAGNASGFSKTAGTLQSLVRLVVFPPLFILICANTRFGLESGLWVGKSLPRYSLLLSPLRSSLAGISGGAPVFAA